MWSGGFATTLDCELARSRGLSAAVVGAYALAAAGLIAALSPLAALAGVAFALGAGALDVYRLGRPLHLYWSPDGHWRIDDPEGPPHTLAAATWSTPWLILLVLRGPEGTRRLAVARDALPPTTWRRLRARLCVEGPAAAGGEG